MKYLGQTSLLSHFTLSLDIGPSQLASQAVRPTPLGVRLPTKPTGSWRETKTSNQHPAFSPPSPPLLILLRISEAQTEATCWGSNFAKLTFCFVAERPAGVIIVRRAWLCWYSRPAEYLERWSGDGEDLRLFGTGEMTQTLIVNLMTEILDRIRYLLFVKLQETLLRNINLNWNKFLYEDFPLNI